MLSDKYEGVVFMFEVDRVYGQRNNRTGLTEWFFTAREGVFGPFASKGKASQAVEKFKKDCVANGNDGGRNLSNGAKLSLLSLDNRLHQTRPRHCRLID